MTRLIHDQFAKQYLTELLSNRGQVETSKDVSGEIKQADVYFIPYTQTPKDLLNLGLLEKLLPMSVLSNHFVMQLLLEKFVVVWENYLIFVQI